jgi:hypothetical protein
VTTYSIIGHGGSILGTLQADSSNHAMTQAKRLGVPFAYLTWLPDPGGKASREGICSSCKEWTSLNDSCCGASVYVDGGLEQPDDE